MASNLNKLQLEKNNFIRELSREQFDSVITNKYKKAFLDYFNGDIGDGELAKKIESNLDLIGIYEDSDSGKLDPNQYLYSAIVDVALNYYNVANGFETCMNKMNLLASYFHLVASAESKLVHLEDAIYDAFFINYNFKDCDDYLNKKLMLVSSLANGLDELLGEISRHEDVISDVEHETKMDFLDELHIDESIKEMYVICSNSAKSINDKFIELQKECFDDSTGAKLDIMKGKLY